MMMGHLHCLETAEACRGFHAVGEFVIYKESKGAIYCVERNGRQPFDQSVIQHFSCGVVFGVDQLLIYLDALMGDFHACIAKYGL